MEEVMNEWQPPSKGPMPHSVPPTLQEATANPRLCRRHLATHEQIWVSLLWGHCSFLLRPGAHKFLFVSSAAAAKSLQSCPTLCDPIDGSPPGFPSLGFSRQEHWSGLPFPSPLHESEK